MDEQHVQFQFGMPASPAAASSFNDSTLIPLIPVSWADQMAKAEALVGKGSDLWTKAQLMAQLTSLTYCGFDAVTAWNCSRWAPASPTAALAPSLRGTAAGGRYTRRALATRPPGRLHGAIVSAHGCAA